MNYGWATVFTLAAWFAGLVIDVNVRVGDLGLRTVLPVIVMGCCIMKFIKDNNAEYSALLTKKKALYPEYRKARDEMQDIVKAQKNVELFFAEEKDSKEKEQIR